MDINLEGTMDGITLASTIRSEYSVPVVYLTGLLDSETLARAMVTEPFGYIGKPFTRRELQVSIEIALYKTRVEQQLREQAQQIQDLLESMNQGFCQISTAGDILNTNSGFARIIGIDQQALLQMNLLDIVCPGDRPKLEKILSTGSADLEKPTEVRLLCSAQAGAKDAPRLPVIVVPKVFRNENGIRGAFLSITEYPDGSGER